MKIREGVLEALKFFGQMDADEILKKLALRGQHTNRDQIQLAVRDLINQKLVRPTDYSKDVYIAR